MPLNLSVNSAALAPWSAALHASSTSLAPMARVRCSCTVGPLGCPAPAAEASGAAGELGCPGEAAAEEGSFSHIRIALFQSPDLAQTRRAPICTSRSGTLLVARNASKSCAHAHACVISHRFTDTTLNNNHYAINREQRIIPTTVDKIQYTCLTILPNKWAASCRHQHYGTSAF